MESRQARAYRIYQAALEVSDESREAYVQSQTGEDPVLRTEVLKLLASAEAADAEDFLATPVADNLMAVAGDSQGPGALPKILGYELGEQLGEGGFGTVYRARQLQPVQRDVAVKIIRRDLCSPALERRFEAERQTLARLNHPNVAQVFDAGTAETGEPYLAMELIDGEPVTRYCDLHDLGLDQRLKLFIDVCAGLQHAHQKGVIHRDIKPANVLVTTGDAKPVPKIIDFGIAKLLDVRVDEQTLATGTGLLGSPAYMSPEQIDPTDQDIDTRSDVYGLGVLLHELLTGTPPFVRGDEGMVSLLNRVLEETPKRPSALLAETRSGRETLSGDLDWIVLKALAKNRDRRYESAAALAADVGRYLRSEPILARAPTPGYRLRRFTRRHRLGVAAALAMAVLLVAGITGTLIGLINAREAAAIAESERQTAQQTVDLLLQFLSSVDPGERGRELKVVELLEAFQDRIDALESQPQLQASLLLTYAQTYFGLGLFDEAEAFGRRALASREQHLGADNVATFEARNLWIRTLYEQGQYQQAADRGHQAMTIATEALGEAHPVTLALAAVTANALLALDQAELAEQLHRRTLETRTRVLGESHPQTLESMALLAKALWRQNQMDEAIALNRDVLDRTREQFGERHPKTLTAINELAVVTTDGGDLESGEKLHRQAMDGRRAVLGPDHPQTLTSMANLAWVLGQRGQLEESEALTRQAWQAEIRTLGPDHRTTLVTQGNLANALTNMGRLDEAEPYLSEVLEKRRAILGAEHADTLIAINDLALVYARQGRNEQAREMLQELVEKRLAVSGPAHPATVTSMGNLATVLGRLDRHAEATKLLRDALLAQLEAMGPDHPRTQRMQFKLARSLKAEGDLDEAESLSRKLLERQVEELGQDHAHTLQTQSLLDQVLQLQGHEAKAPGVPNR